MTSIKQEDFPYRNIIYKNKKEVYNIKMIIKIILY